MCKHKPLPSMYIWAIGAHNSSLEGATKLKFTIRLLLRWPFIWCPFFAEVKFFRFWPKTMDYNKAFLPKSR